MPTYSEEIDSRLITVDIGDQNAIESPITISARGYTIRFTDEFQGHHLRRMRSNTMTQLAGTKAEKIGKVTSLVKEGEGAASQRFMQGGTPEEARNSLLYLDIGGFCSLGAQIAKNINNSAWEPFRGNANRLQQNVVILLDRAMMISGNGFGQADKLRSGVGVTLTATIERGENNLLQVVHFAEGGVSQNFADGHGPGKKGTKIVLSGQRANQVANSLAR